MFITGLQTPGVIVLSVQSQQQVVAAVVLGPSLLLLVVQVEAVLALCPEVPEYQDKVFLEVLVDCQVLGVVVEVALGVLAQRSPQPAEVSGALALRLQ